jgi:hypothetical protein
MTEKATTGSKFVPRTGEEILRESICELREDIAAFRAKEISHNKEKI